ncbi:flagellar basal body rod protein FlgC [Oricola cellulosilytica]|uniref:Flagellar basal-body rod protein FlgC n=1 Tax=Oricola cellulosilytica TaxID=1429082 RepID=A0A4R0PEG8_9HYPH|nr:flagellar basal body rod protein FlgC [Oricola cellulosilytica]TCD16196.1 flagellar basal body rod protein FlgC [Oricola cellulosilytica]
MDFLDTAIKVAASGLNAETTRLRVVSENIANAQSTAKIPGGDPFQRKLVTFGSELDRASNAAKVSVNSVRTDNTAFPTKHDPAHPAADENGFVKMPNVNVLIEMADMREANRSYQANLQVLKQARDLISMTIDLMRTR